MLGRRLSMKKLAKNLKVSSNNNNPNGVDNEPSQYESLLLPETEQGGSPRTRTPTGSFAVYVGVERRRFVVPTSYLSHPLFKIMLDKAFSDEFGFEHKKGLVVPCSVSAFQEVVSAVECSNKKFDFGDLVEEFI